MLRNILGKTSETMFLDYVLEFNEPFTLQEACKKAHVSAKRMAVVIPKMLRYHLIACVNPEAPEAMRRYQNGDSTMFKAFLKIDFIEASSLLDEKRKHMPKN